MKTKTPKGKTEMYACPSYYDDSNVLQDCTCGKCESMNKPTHQSEGKHKHIWKYREGSNKRVCEAPIPTIESCGKEESLTPPTRDWYDSLFDTDRDLYFKIKELLAEQRQEMIKELEGLKRIRKPGHGICCTCQVCGYNNEDQDCECNRNLALADAIAKIRGVDSPPLGEE